MKLRELEQGKIYAIPNINKIVKYQSHYLDNTCSHVHVVLGDFLDMPHIKNNRSLKYYGREEVFCLSKSIFEATEEQIRFFCENSREDLNKYIKKNSSSFSLFNILKYS